MSFNCRLLRPLGCLLGAASLCATLAMPATTAYGIDTPSAKREIVTATTNASGSVRSISVDTTLETDGRTTVADSTKLYRIEYDDDKIWSSQNNGTMQWSSQDGRDITYTGQSNNALPVQLKISYTLNGNAIQPSELVGRSGHVVIRYTYLDAEQELKGTTPYLPFAAVTRVPLDTSIFSNIKVTNGKLVSVPEVVEEDAPESTLIYAIGGGVTGSAEALTEEQKKELPTSFEIEADTSYFLLASATTIMSNNLLSCLDSELMSVSETSVELAAEYANLLVRIEDIRTAIEELAEETSDLSEDFEKVTTLADELDLAMGELDKAQDSIDQMNEYSDTLISQVDYVSDATKEFYAFIGSVDGLSDEQIEALYSKWSELDIDGAVEEAASGARYLLSLSNEINLSQTMIASDSMKDIDFKKLGEVTENLDDTLKNLLEKDFGNTDDVTPDDPPKNEEGEEETTLFGDANRLQETLVDKLNEDLMTPTSTAGGVSGAHLVVSAPTPEKEAEDAKDVEKGLIAKVNHVIDEAYNEVLAAEATQEPAKKEYTNYGGITEDTEGTVQFVLRSPGIK